MESCRAGFAGFVVGQNGAVSDYHSVMQVAWRIFKLIFLGGSASAADTAAEEEDSADLSGPRDEDLITITILHFLGNYYRLCPDRYVV